MRYVIVSHVILQSESDDCGRGHQYVLNLRMRLSTKNKITQNCILKIGHAHTTHEQQRFAFEPFGPPRGQLASPAMRMCPNAFVFVFVALCVFIARMHTMCVHTTNEQDRQQILYNVCLFASDVSRCCFKPRSLPDLLPKNALSLDRNDTPPRLSTRTHRWRVQ